jgi:hypothetical protein
MSAPALPPNPSLVAIILIVKTRRGVKRIFHYPPNPGKERPHAKLDYERASEEESSSSSEEDTESSLEDTAEDEEKQLGSRAATPELDEASSVSPEKNDNDGWRKRTKAKASGFLGLPEGFDSFLCPGSELHRKRFELTIGQLVFLGWPVYAKNGAWRPKRRSRGARDHARQPPRKMSTISEQELANMSRRNSVQVDYLLGETTGNESLDEEQGHMTEEETKTAFEEMPTLHEGEPDIDDSDNKLNPELAMFHVVFVMNPPALEYQLRVDEMYRHVVKKFSRALKWEQSRSGYVQKECEKLRQVKAKHGMITSHYRWPSLTGTRVSCSNSNSQFVPCKGYCHGLRLHIYVSNRSCGSYSASFVFIADTHSDIHLTSSRSRCTASTRPLADDSDFHPIQ